MSRDAHALVFGVSSYVHYEALPAAVTRGAAELASILTDPHLGGYREDRAHLLLDAEVTREAILEELAILSQITEPGSTVVVYFAGHGGGAAAGVPEEVHLLPAAADPDSLAETAVSGSELAAALAVIPARRMLVIFDCCHAGGLKGAAAPHLNGGVPEVYCQRLAAAGGRVILAAARSNERSWIPADGGPSYFTRHLLAALRGAVGEEGLVKVWDLFEYLQPRVTAECSDQHPVFKAELEDNFAVALALGGQGGMSCRADGDYLYDAYLSYADREPDASWVWEQLVPRLEEAGLKLAVSGDVEEPGVARVVAAERGIERARRTVVVLSEAYLEDEMTGFIDALAQTVGLEQGVARLVPVRYGAMPTDRLPARLRMLVSLDLSHAVPARARRNFNRLVRALHSPPARS